MLPRVIFVDVDDTLVRSVGSKRIPMPNVIKRLRQLKDEGVVMYLWSSGGAEYCRATTAELQLENCFSGFLPKPNRYIDDQPVHEWKFCRHIYPLQADNA